MNRNAPAAKCGDRFQIDPTGIIVPVAEQHHRADRQVGCFAGQLLQAIPDARGGGRSRRFQIIELSDARQMAVDAVEANLEFLLQFVEHAAFERLDGLRLTRRPILRNGHAARIVHQDRNNVLLRPEFGN